MGMLWSDVCRREFYLATVWRTHFWGAIMEASTLIRISCSSGKIMIALTQGARSQWLGPGLWMWRW